MIVRFFLSRSGIRLSFTNTFNNLSLHFLNTVSVLFTKKLGLYLILCYTDIYKMKTMYDFQVINYK